MTTTAQAVVNALQAKAVEASAIAGFDVFTQGTGFLIRTDTRDYRFRPEGGNIVFQIVDIEGREVFRALLMAGGQARDMLADQIARIAADCQVARINAGGLVSQR